MAQSLVLLDTSFLIRSLFQSSAEAEALRGWVIAGTPRTGISSVAWAEFLCSPLNSHQLALAAQIVGEPESFSGEDSAIAANLYNQSGRRRGSLMDCMIAAVALRLGASLATANPGDFRHFKDLKLLRIG